MLTIKSDAFCPPNSHFEIHLPVVELEICLTGKSANKTVRLLHNYWILIVEGGWVG